MVTKTVIRREACLAYVLAALLLSGAGQAHLYADGPSQRLLAGSSDHSVFQSVWSALLKEASIDADLRLAPANIRRFWFVENTVQLDCCSIPEWRQRPAELATQIYTDPIFYSLQFFIHHKDMVVEYNKPEDLLNYRVAVITGHTHMHEEFFGARVEANSFTTLFELIAEGRADIASVNEQEFHFQMGRRDWPVVRGPVFHHLPLRARVRNEYAYLVPLLNDAITRLKLNGQIDTLIGQAMRGEIYEED